MINARQPDHQGMMLLPLTPSAKILRPLGNWFLVKLGHIR